MRYQVMGFDAQKQKNVRVTLEAGSPEAAVARVKQLGIKPTSVAPEPDTPARQTASPAAQRSMARLTPVAADAAAGVDLGSLSALEENSAEAELVPAPNARRAATQELPFPPTRPMLHDGGHGDVKGRSTKHILWGVLGAGVLLAVAALVAGYWWLGRSEGNIASFKPYLVPDAGMVADVNVDKVRSAPWFNEFRSTMEKANPDVAGSLFNDIDDMSEVFLSAPMSGSSDQDLLAVARSHSDLPLEQRKGYAGPTQERGGYPYGELLAGQTKLVVAKVGKRTYLVGMRAEVVEAALDRLHDKTQVSLSPDLEKAISEASGSDHFVAAALPSAASDASGLKVIGVGLSGTSRMQIKAMGIMTNEAKAGEVYKKMTEGLAKAKEGMEKAKSSGAKPTGPMADMQRSAEQVLNSITIRQDGAIWVYDRCCGSGMADKRQGEGNPLELRSRRIDHASNYRGRTEGPASRVCGGGRAGL